jgi:hypothetical protein
VPNQLQSLTVDFMCLLETFHTVLHSTYGESVFLESSQLLQLENHPRPGSGGAHLALERQRQADFSVRGQPGLQSEFQDSQEYTEKPCLEKPKYIYIYIYVCVCVCVCVCVKNPIYIYICVCVCVCVCIKERKKERKEGRKKIIHSSNFP